MERSGKRGYEKAHCWRVVYMVDELSSIARYVTMFQQRHPRFEAKELVPNHVRL